MFVVATKMAIVEAFRSIWYDNQNVGQENHDLQLDLTPNDSPIPRRVTIDYPEEEQNWPFILVQVRPTIVRWTGVMPDETFNAGTEEVPEWVRIRQGYFEATCMLQIMALSSGERDRIWDNLIKIILMGRKRSATSRFWESIETNGLVGITVNEGQIGMIGDTISMGAPWETGAETLTYEASIEFDMVGTFFGDEYNENLVSLRTAQVFEYIDIGDGAPDNEPPPGENDGQGQWQSPWEV